MKRQLYVLAKRNWFQRTFFPTKLEKIERLKKEIKRLNAQIGECYKNPLGDAFDMWDSQEDHDRFFQNEITRRQDKIKKLEACSK